MWSASYAFWYLMNISLMMGTPWGVLTALNFFLILGKCIVCKRGCPSGVTGALNAFWSWMYESFTKGMT